MDASRTCLFVAELIVSVLKKRHSDYLLFDSLEWEITEEAGSSATASIYILQNSTEKKPLAFLLDVEITVNPTNGAVIRKKITFLKDCNNFFPADFTKELTGVLRSFGWNIVTKYA